MIIVKNSATKGKRYEARFNGVYLGTWDAKKDALLVVKQAKLARKAQKLIKYQSKAVKPREGAGNG